MSVAVAGMKNLDFFFALRGTVGFGKQSIPVFLGKGSIPDEGVRQPQKRSGEDPELGSGWICGGQAARERHLCDAIFRVRGATPGDQRSGSWARCREASI